MQMRFISFHLSHNLAKGVKDKTQHFVVRTFEVVSVSCFTRLHFLAPYMSDTYFSADSSGDDSTADLSWLARLDLTSPALSVTSHQVGLGRRIPLIVTTPVQDPAVNTTL